MKRIALLALCVLLASTISQAQNQYALLVGISQYKEIAPLQFADRDAIAFAEFLKTQQVPDDHIKLFLNENATRVNIVDELYTLTETLKPRDRFYFYFGGHGDLEAHISHENSLLLLYNSFRSGYFKGNEFLQLSELKMWFDALTKKQVEVIFIADACHSGGLIGGKEGRGKTQKALLERWGSVTKILSSQADEFSLEGKQWGGGRGLFSYHLVNGLTGRADGNKDKKVSLGELGSYLKTNVLREANPNVQTPVVMGSTTAQLLSTVSAAGLARLADYEKRNFPIITEVNLKGGDEKLYELLLSKLDTSLVSIYRRFSKSLKEKRVATSDDSTDNALLHYKKLTSRTIPPNLVQLMKRNLAVGLLERELEIMKGIREKGQPFITINDKIPQPAIADKVFMAAIANIEETMTLFGPNHYFYKYLQARKGILEMQLSPKSFPIFVNANTVDKNIQDQKEFARKLNLMRKESLLKSLDLEPNMISTYVLLSTAYRANRQPDSALYYQEKVVELLPNQGYAYLNLAMNYQSMKYVDTLNRPASHPKAIAYLEKAIAVEPALSDPYPLLVDLYISVYADEANRNYTKAIPYVEKMVAPDEAKEQEFIKQGLTKLREPIRGTFDPYFSNYVGLISNWSKLYFLHKLTGNPEKAAVYLEKLLRKADRGQSVYGYLLVARKMYDWLGWEEEESYLKIALDLQLKALKKRDEELTTATAENKPLLTVQYREQLTGIGGTYRLLKNYSEAESYTQRAIAYPVVESPILSHLKLVNSSGIYYKNTLILNPSPWSVQKMHANGEYGYSLDANLEMFFLKWDQNKHDEAFAWLEKAFQVSAAEHGNDISGKPFEESIFEAFKTMDKERFLALKVKYFPPAEKK